MTKRIFRSVFLAALAATLLAALALSFMMYEKLSDRLETVRVDESGMIAAALETVDSRTAYLSNLSDVSARLTLISPDGTVLYDNEADPATMENHLSRPEVQDAIENGRGESTRYSETLFELTSYYARRLSDGSILRIATTQNSVLGIVLGMAQPALLFIIIVAIACYFAARVVARHITAPLNVLDLDNPLKNDAYDELSPLLIRLEHQRRTIAEQLDELSEKQREFSAVTDHMNEGLVVLNASGKVLSVNRSAMAFLGAQGDKTGRHYVELDRGAELAEVAEKALSGKNGETMLSRGGRTCQLLSSPVENAGAVVLILDVTERESAAAARREFTANVSHELKTPLTSISGYAEIMMNGLAGAEKTAEFAGRIYSEANRLINLVEDIIELSLLDERTELPRENIDLLEIANDACLSLQEAAQKRGVTLTAEGESAIIYGVRPVITEMAFNLCDNAVKYNIRGGSAKVAVKNSDDSAILEVSDTGIGIPDKYKEKVFERFFRVDKSRSKETGGTGLGLSIVRHGALCHDARVELFSEEGKGTTVRLTFPKNALRE